MLKNLLVPFRNAAKLVFLKETVGAFPTGSETLTVVLNKDTLNAKADSASWLKPHLTNEMVVKDLEKGKVVWMYPDKEGVKRMLLVPSIDEKETDKGKVMRATAKTIIQELKSRNINDSLLAFNDFSADEIGKCLNTGIIEAAEHTKKKPDPEKKTTLEEFKILLKEDLYTKINEINYWIELANGIILSQNLVNQSPSLATPSWMQEQVQSLFQSCEKIKVTSIVGEELEEKNYSCIYAVGKGAVAAPRIVTIEYKGNPSDSKTDLAFVGKGVTFDAGGLNIKPTGSIEDMHLDKSGACNVIAAMHCINTLNLPINVVGCLTLAENAVGKNSYKPSDILNSFYGKTVEVTNTDAEGRLCLIDGMGHVQKYHKPKVLIDIATLTGACMVALGCDAAGLFSNDDDLANSLLKCSSIVSEVFWRLPIFPEHTKAMKGRVADLKNAGSRYGGACTAAAFLKEFVDSDVKWAHLDIAGPAMRSESVSKVSFGTGFGTQLLVEFAKSLTSH